MNRRAADGVRMHVVGRVGNPSLDRDRCARQNANPMHRFGHDGVLT
jgi:hypothetical protein